MVFSTLCLRLFLLLLVVYFMPASFLYYHVYYPLQLTTLQIFQCILHIYQNISINGKRCVTKDFLVHTNTNDLRD